MKPKGKKEDFEMENLENELVEEVMASSIDMKKVAIGAAVVGATALAATVGVKFYKKHKEAKLNQEPIVGGIPVPNLED